MMNQKAMKPEEHPDLDGKIFKGLSDGYNPEVTTYYKFGKYDRQRGTYSAHYVQTNNSNQMINAFPYVFQGGSIKQALNQMTEISSADFFFIVRDAIDQYVNHTKTVLGVLKEPK